jgi:opacity protein-like surface antigen
MHNFIRHLLFSLLLVSTCANAVEETSAEMPAPATVLPGDFIFYLGDFRADDNTHDLQNPDSDFSIGIGAYSSFLPYLDFGVDMQFTFSDYDTPNLPSDPFTVIYDEMSLSTLGLAGVIRARYDTDYSRVFVGAGAGLYFSRLAVYASTFGFPGTHEERDNNLGFFYNAGLMLKLTPEQLLGVEYRKLMLEAGFGPVTQDDADIGGEFALLTYSYIFK